MTSTKLPGLVLLPVILFLFLFGVGCGHKGPSEPEFVLRNVGPDEAKMMVHYGIENDSLTILDVRTPKEFAGGHLKQAVNVDYNGGAFASGLADIDKQKDLLVHCASGGRSTACLKELEAAGFRKVFHLDGGYKAWRSAGLPVTKE